MARRVGRLLEGLLGHPRVFNFQQRIFARQYRALSRAFGPWLVSRQTVLDIGCGTGACAASLLSFETVSYLGVEMNRRYVDFARRRYRSAEFVCADACHLDLSDRSFAAVLMFSVLHHLSDEAAQQVMRKVRSAVTAGGVVLSAEPLFPDPGHYRGIARVRALVSLGLLRMDRGDHIRDREGYLRLWQGFEPKEECTFRSSLHDFYGVVLTVTDAR